MKDLKLPHAIVISVALLVLGGLAYFEKDAAAVITGVVALLGVMGFVAYQQTEIKQTAATIERNTNGTNSQLLETIDRLQRENTDLALRVQPPSETSPSQD